MSTDVTIDNWQRSQISRMMDISVAVYDYIANEHYLNDSEEGDVVTDMTILRECHLLLIGDLKEMGLDFTSDPIDLTSDGHRAETLIYAREVFDRMRFRDTIRGLSMEGLNELSDILDNYEEPEEALEHVIYLLAEEFPGIEYQRLFDDMDYFLGTDEFLDHLRAIKQDVVSIQEQQASLNVLDMPVIQAYMEYKMHHIEDVTRATLELGKIWGVERDVLQQRLNVHDRDLIGATSVVGAAYGWMARNAVENTGESTLGITMEEEHHRSNTHHLEYFSGKWEHITEVDLVEIAGDVYGRDLSKLSYLEKLQATMGEVKDLPEQVREKLMRMGESLNIFQKE